MPIYCLNSNSQDNGDHEVHNVDCQWAKKILKPIDLGYHPNCRYAVQKARDDNPGYKIDGCIHCCPECHRS